MDIRNIKTPQPEITDGKYLEGLFDIQSKLMEGYYKIEGLPRPPLDINLKSTQVILKDFSSRVIEEIAEGFESTNYAVELCRSVGWNLHRLSDDRKQMVINHLQNTNEEMADATAFFTELMMYANITPNDVYEYCNQQLDITTKVTKLFDVMLTGSLLLMKEHPCWTTIKDENEYQVLESVVGEEKFEAVRKYIPGFNHLSEYSHEMEALLTWSVTYHLNIGRNFLKNKTWKQSGELTNELQYQEQVVLAFIKFCGYMLIFGFTPDTWFHLCWRKNQVNFFRQRSNY